MALWCGFIPYYIRCGGNTVVMFISIEQVPAPAGGGCKSPWAVRGLGFLLCQPKLEPPVGAQLKLVLCASLCASLLAILP